MKRIGVISLLLMSCAFSRAGTFLTQEEIDAKLAAILSESKGVASWRDVFHGYKRGSRFEYVCKVCGHHTVYNARDDYVIDLQSLLAKLHKAVAEFRDRRLDISVDERILCGKCRVALKVPDMGEIVSVPKPPPYQARYFMHRTAVITNFPLRVGDKVRIISDSGIDYCVTKVDGEYWVPESCVSMDGRIKSGISVPVHVGPGSNFWKVATIGHFWTGGGVSPNSLSNGWHKLWSASGFAIPVCKKGVGNLVMAGEDTCRRDLHSYLMWNIGGKTRRIRAGDDMIIRYFLDDVPQARHYARRLQDLFGQCNHDSGIKSGSGSDADDDVQVEVNL